MSTAMKSAEPNASTDGQLIITHVTRVSVTAANKHNKTITVHYNQYYSVGQKSEQCLQVSTVCTSYSVSQKSSPLKLFAIFSLVVNLCN